MDTLGPVGSETADKIDVPLTAYRKPLRTWAGHGTGAPCSACGETIQPQDVEYEIELPAMSTERPTRFQPGTDGRSLRFHFSCYRRWTHR
jgi:hypothetical protein